MAETRAMTATMATSDEKILFKAPEVGRLTGFSEGTIRHRVAKRPRKDEGEISADAATLGQRTTEDRLMDVREVAEFLGLAVGTIYHLVSQRRLPCIRLSARCLRFRRGDL